MNYLIFLGTRFKSQTSGIERYLAQYLSKYGQVICFEYPHFSQVLRFLKNKEPFLEENSSSLKIIHSFGILPFGRTFRFINWVNHRINYNFIKPFSKEKNIKVITFTPELMYLLDKIGDLDIFYYVSDDYKTLPQWKNYCQKRQFDLLEKDLMKIAKGVFVTSVSLYRRYKPLYDNVCLFPIPSNAKLYANFDSKKNKKPSDLKNIPHPIAGFIGSYYDWKIDTEFLIRIIQKSPKVSFVFLGTIKINDLVLYNKLLNLSNVYYLGCKSVQELPPYVANFDTCLIPYRTNQYGQSAYPVKIMEYLAMGKPVVSTALPSVKHLADRGLIYWLENENQFVNFLDRALNEKRNSRLIKMRQFEAIKNDWSVRIKQFLKLINNG